MHNRTEIRIIETEGDDMKLRPMICKECKTANDIQEMLNTANCTINDCNGFMEYLDDETYAEIKLV